MGKTIDDRRNFLFFLSDIHPLNLEDTLIGALAVLSTWENLAQRVRTARKKDHFAGSIKKAFLYVHVPFCGQICSFCHCSRVLLKRRSEIDEFIDILERQMMILSPAFKGMDAGSICFGGGTPSILDTTQLARLLDGVDRTFPAAARKIFFEIHPSSWTQAKLSLLAQRGLYRLSVGAQSFDQKVLKGVTRYQTKQKVLWCLHSAKKAGIPIVNIDFIAGLPGQTIKGLLKDLKIIISEGANNIHLQPYTSLSWKELCSPGEKIQDFLKRRDAMMRQATDLLLAEGFCCKGVGEYARNEGGLKKNGGQYPLPETAVAAFGPFAMGEFPGTVFYRVGAESGRGDLPPVKAAIEEPGYAMSQYALLAAINGLDEKVFQQRFGISLDAHCGEGLRFLKDHGLLSCTKGVWRFSGKWEFARVREYAALSRVLFGEKILLRLRIHYLKQYDPGHDYSEGGAFLRAQVQNWLMTLYYNRRV